MITTIAESREDRVRSLHARLNPSTAKGLALTDEERTLLLGRLEAIQVEIDNAPSYGGAFTQYGELTVTPR